MSTIPSSSNTGRSASGALSDNTIASSTSSNSRAFDFPQRVATSGQSGSIAAIRRQRARYLTPFFDEYSTDFDKNFQDWEFEWNFDTILVPQLLAFIRTEYHLPIPSNTPVWTIGEGCYNKVFAFRTEAMDGEAGPDALPQILVLRIGWPLAPKYKLESDVATMTFARREAGLPVPKVLWYDSSASNPWDLQWSVVEFVDGPAFELVDALWDNPQCEAMKNLAEIINGHCESLTKCHNFDKIGSLYFAEHEWNTCGPMGVEGYVVGPSAEFKFWMGPRAYYVDLPRGPFNSVEDYISAHVELHIRDLNNTDIPDAAFSFDASCRCPTKYEAPHTCPHDKKMRQQLLKLAQEVQSKLIPAAVRKAELAARADGYTGPLGGCGATLWHHDLHMGNIHLLPVATETRYDPDFDGPGIAAILDWEMISVKPRFLHNPVPKVARSFNFLEEDRGNFPAGDQNKGPSLQDLFEGRAARTNMFPKVFNPPPESMAPWGVALLNIITMIGTMGAMDTDEIEWWMDALQYLGFPQNGSDYGLDDNDDDNDQGPDGGKKGDDDAGGSFNGSDTPVHWGGPPRHKHNREGGKGHQDANLDRFDRFSGAFKRARHMKVRAAPRNCFPPRPFNREEFLKLPIYPQEPVSPKADASQSKDRKPDLTLPPLTPASEQLEMTSIPLTPGPSSPVHVQYHALNMTMQVPLQDLIRGIESNEHLYAMNQPHDVVSATPRAQDIAHAPPVAPISWVPAFLSTFICCY
jgi:hypothetical protein